jgi:hypothetical protein
MRDRSSVPPLLSSLPPPLDQTRSREHANEINIRESISKSARVT